MVIKKKIFQKKNFKKISYFIYNFSKKYFTYRDFLSKNFLITIFRSNINYYLKLTIGLLVVLLFF